MSEYFFRPMARSSERYSERRYATSERISQESGGEGETNVCYLRPRSSLFQGSPFYKPRKKEAD
jgi:hypothetical protein